jgi:hypothetical protein
VVPAGDEADAFIVPARAGAATTPSPASACSWSSGRRRQVRGYPTQDGARAAD